MNCTDDMRPTGVSRGGAERGTAGPDTRGWLRLVVPLSPDSSAALPSRLADR